MLSTGEALTQSSLLEADGENGGGLVTMTTAVEPMNLHHAMLRSPGRHLNMREKAHTVGGITVNTSDSVTVNAANAYLELDHKCPVAVRDAESTCYQCVVTGSLSHDRSFLAA